MYRIDKLSNVIQPLNKCSSSKIGSRERAHLQEWTAKYPSVLGEELLVIQKEFAGFSDTRERLDLLALDKEDSLVIIEHKLDLAGFKICLLLRSSHEGGNPPNLPGLSGPHHRTRKLTIG